MTAQNGLSATVAANNLTGSNFSTANIWANNNNSGLQLYTANGGNFFSASWLGTSSWYWAISALPTSYPGAGSKQVWADAANGYVLKWAV